MTALAAIKRQFGPMDGKPRLFHYWIVHAWFGIAACAFCHQWDVDVRFFAKCPGRPVGTAWGEEERQRSLSTIEAGRND